MNLSDARTRVADDGNVNQNVTGVSARLTREINRVCEEMWNGKAWTFRFRNYRIVTDTDVTTGTLTATNGSRTVTASGTPFLSTHVGWHIYFPGDSVLNFYKVRAFTSTSQIELDVPYQGTTGSGKSYFLRHFDYVLPTEIYDMGSVVPTYHGRPMSILYPSSLEILEPVPLTNGWPSAIAVFGSDSMPTTYSTGTLSGTINTNTVTGSSTSWLANVYPGDDLTIGSYTYTVYSVDSDTQLTLYNKQQVTSSAGTSYTITSQYGRLVRIMWPSNLNYVIDIRGLRRYAPLVNDSDSNELLERCPEAVIKKAAAMELKQQNDRRQMEQAAELALIRARADDDALSITDNVAPIYTYRWNEQKMERIR